MKQQYFKASSIRKRCYYSYLPHPGSMSYPSLTNHMVPNSHMKLQKMDTIFPWNTQHIFASQRQHLLQNLTVHPQQIHQWVHKYAKSTANCPHLCLKSTHHRHHIFCKRFFLSRFMSRTCMLIRVGKKSMGKLCIHHAIMSRLFRMVLPIPLFPFCIIAANSPWSIRPS